MAFCVRTGTCTLTAVKPLELRPGTLGSAAGSPLGVLRQDRCTKNNMLYVCVCVCACVCMCLCVRAYKLWI